MHVSDEIRALFGRGDLPERIRLVRARGGMPAGRCFFWDGSLGAYADAQGADATVMAGIVARQWGEFFGAA